MGRELPAATGSSRPGADVADLGHTSRSDYLLARSTLISMRISGIVQAIALLALTLNAHAESIPASAKKILIRIFPSTQIRSTAVGDLDGDGINDIVAVVARASAGEGAQRIVV